MENALIMPLNKKQILLDWINTIDEPQCLLVSELDHLKDGSVFLEILKNYLKQTKANKQLLKDIKNVDYFDDKTKFNLIFHILVEFIDSDLLRKFQPYEKMLKNSSLMLEFIQMLKSLLEGEKEEDGNGEDEERFNYNQEGNYEIHELSELSGGRQNNNYYNEDVGRSANSSKYRIIDEDEQYNYEIAESIEKMHTDPNNNANFNFGDKKETTHYNIKNFINNFAYEKDENFQNQNSKKKVFTNLKKNFESDKDEEISSDCKKIYIGNMHEVKRNTPKGIMEITNSNFDIIPAIVHANEKPLIKVKQEKQVIPKINNIPTPTIEKLELKINATPKNNKTIAFTENNKLKNDAKTIKKAPTQTATPSKHDPDFSLNFSLSHTNNRSVSPDQYPNVDFNKIYSKREKAELSMFRGIPYPNTKSNTSNNIELKNFKIGFFKFLKPTTPILNVDYSTIVKYQPSADFVKNTIISNKLKEKENEDKSLMITDRSQISNILKNKFQNKSLTRNRNVNMNVTPGKIKFNILDISAHTTMEYNEVVAAAVEPKKLPVFNADLNSDLNSDLNLISKSVSNISSALKNKIYFWLIDLNILKENSIKADDLPSLCANGVLISDLINRLEGRTEIIKGIIRKTTTKSHIQVNINKMLQHLRDISKFNKRHLWSNNEVSCADPQTIWELLDDIWNFYSNKNSNIKNDVLKRKNKNKENEFIMTTINKSPSRNLVDKSKISSLTLTTSNRNIGIKSKKGQDDTTNLNLNLNDNSEIYSNPPQPFTNNIKYNDVSNYQKAIVDNISQITNKSSLRKENVSSNKNNELFANNINAIANCLGMNTAKARKKREAPTSYSFSSNKIEKSDKLDKIEKLEKLEKLERTPSTSKILFTNTNINESKQNILTKNNSSSKINGYKTNLTLNNNTTINTKSNSKEKNCFVIFQKSNAKKLQKEIDRYDQNFANEISSNLNINYNNEEKANINKNKNRFLLASNHEDNFDSFFKGQSEQQTLITEDSTIPKSKTFIEKESEDMNIKDWLYAIGINWAYDVNLTKEELNEFKDGILLSQIVSLLENKKIAGVNPNPRSSSSCVKNIAKCLEVLRNKKNMPYDHLWSEEEISRGNGYVIRGLLKHMKKAYGKQTEFCTSGNTK